MKTNIGIHRIKILLKISRNTVILQFLIFSSRATTPDRRFDVERRRGNSVDSLRRPMPLNVNQIHSSHAENIGHFVSILIFSCILVFSINFKIFSILVIYVLNCKSTIVLSWLSFSERSTFLFK